MPNLQDTQAVLQSLTTESSSFRASQAVLQSLTTESGSFRASQASLIFLCSEADAPAIPLRTSQLVLQALMPDTFTRTSQLVLQALMPDTFTEVTQLIIEGLADETASFQGTQAILEFTVPDAGFTHLSYVMRAFDAAGGRFVYWETDDPSLAPLMTMPFAVGALTDVRIFFDFDGSR